LFRSDDGRVEVVFDLDELSESRMKLVANAALAALDAEHAGGPDRITVMITGDERIRELNREFMGEDEVTDVLSFSEPGNKPVNEAPGAAVSSDNNDTWPDISGADEVESDRLGDIAISLPQVVRQAAENGKPTDRELAMLTVHGVLHLLGYDHAGVEDEKVMFGKTDVVLAELFGE
jgi:probable rRNA maturation factor